MRGAADLGLQLRFAAGTEGRFLLEGAAKTTLCRQRIHTNVFFRSLVFVLLTFGRSGGISLSCPCVSRIYSQMFSHSRRGGWMKPLKILTFRGIE